MLERKMSLTYINTETVWGLFVDFISADILWISNLGSTWAEEKKNCLCILKLYGDV